MDLNRPRLRTSAGPFLDFLEFWVDQLPVVSMKSILKKFSEEQTALFCVDMLNGFCKKGNLYSPRQKAIIPSVTNLFKTAEQHGLKYFVLPQDAHPPNSKEFDVYPEHCVEGSEESKTVKEISELPSFYKYRVLPKNTIIPGLAPNLQTYLKENGNLRQFIVAGVCTDICIYHLALFLKVWPSQQGIFSRVIVPADCVETYDVPFDDDRPSASHPADLLHSIFLYHLHLNGVEVVGGIE